MQTQAFSSTSQNVKFAIYESIACNATAQITVANHNRAETIAAMSALSNSQLVIDGNRYLGTDNDGNEWAIRLS